MGPVLPSEQWMQQFCELRLQSFFLQCFQDGAKLCIDIGLTSPVLQYYAVLPFRCPISNCVPQSFCTLNVRAMWNARCLGKFPSSANHSKRSAVQHVRIFLSGVWTCLVFQDCRGLSFPSCNFLKPKAAMRHAWGALRSESRRKHEIVDINFDMDFDMDFAFDIHYHTLLSSSFCLENELPACIMTVWVHVSCTLGEGCTYN